MICLCWALISQQRCYYQVALSGFSLHSLKLISRVFAPSIPVNLLLIAIANLFYCLQESFVEFCIQESVYRFPHSTTAIGLYSAIARVQGEKAEAYTHAQIY